MSAFLDPIGHQPRDGDGAMSTFIDPMYIGSGTAETDRMPRAFIEAMHRTPGSPKILELGTLRWEAALPTHHTAWLPDAEWTRSDISDGIDVDVVADAHELGPFADAAFEGVVAVSVFEHLERPWLAAEAIARVLRSEGYAYISTHHTFPLHGYPSDFFRFSIEGLRVIFEDAGMTTVAAGYAYHGRLVPPAEVSRWNPGALCPLVVDLLAMKLP